jgi:hypothetical protein
VALVLLFVFALAIGAQDNPCAACHGEPVDDFKTHKHATAGLNCTSCHGSSEKHRAATGSAPPDRVAAPNEVAGLCGQCHGSQRKEYETSAHAKVYASGRNVRTANCNTCHGHHALRSFAAMANACGRCHGELPAACKQPPKSTAVKVSCMNCHAKHTLQWR